MLVGIDIRCLGGGKNTGVEEYTVKLLHQLFSMDQKNKFVLFLNSYGKTKFDFSEFEKYKNVSLKKFNIPNKILNFCFWYFKWPFVDEMIGGVDVFAGVKSGTVVLINTEKEVKELKIPRQVL